LKRIILYEVSKHYIQTGYPYAPESVEFGRVERVSNGVEGGLMNQGRQKSSRREAVFHVG
jgi:hypothetical protein